MAALAETQFYFTFVASLLGGALALWGLRLYVATVVLVGAAAGALAGALAGAFTASEQAATALGFVGAVVGGVLAWPLKKALIFLAAGLTIGALVLFAAAGKVSENAAWALFVSAFVSSGFLAVVFHEWMVIGTSSLVAGTLLFAAHLVAQFPFAGGLGRLVREVGDYLQTELAAFVWVLAGSLFVGFAIQRAWVGEGTESEEHLMRRGAYLVTAVLVVTLAGTATDIVYLQDLLIITGFTSLSWPAAIALLVPTLAMCRSRGIGGLRSPVAWGVGLTFGVVVGLLDSALWRTLAEHYTIGAQYLSSWLMAEDLLLQKLIWTVAVFPVLFTSMVIRSPEPEGSISGESEPEGRVTDNDSPGNRAVSGESHGSNSGRE